MHALFSVLIDDIAYSVFFRISVVSKGVMFSVARVQRQRYIYMGSYTITTNMVGACTTIYVRPFIPRLEEYSRRIHAQKNTANQNPRMPLHVLRYATVSTLYSTKVSRRSSRPPCKFSRPAPGSVNGHLLNQLSLDFATAEPNNCLEFDILNVLSSSNLRKNLSLETEERRNILCKRRGIQETATEIQERLRKFLLARPLSCLLKTNVLKQEFSKTYSQNKAEKTSILGSQLIRRKEDRRN